MTRFLLFLLLLFPAYVQAIDYYVTPSGGSSSASSCPSGSPCTPGRGMALAGPGDSVIFKNGTYNFQIATQRNGTSSAPIRIRAENRRQAVIRFPSSPSGGKPRLASIAHDWIVLSGFWFQGIPDSTDMIRVGGNSSGDWADDNIIEDNLIYLSGAAATNFHDARRITYRYNEINTTSTQPPNVGSPGGSGFYMGSAPSNNSRVENSQVYNNLVRNVREHNLVDYKNGTLNINFHHNIFDGHVPAVDGGRADGLIRSADNGDGIDDANHLFTDSIIKDSTGCLYLLRLDREVDALRNVFWNTECANNIFIDSRTSTRSDVDQNITCDQSTTVEEVDRGNNQHNRPMSECHTRAKQIVGVPSITSCEVGGINDNTVVVNMNAGGHPPISTVGTAGQLAITYNGVAQTENSVTLTSANQARIVMASSPATSGVQVRVSAAAGIIKNSAWIGGKSCGSTYDNLVLGQGVCGVNDVTPGSGVLCTNTTGGTPAPVETLNQAVYRFYAANQAQGAGALAAQNTNIRLPQGAAFRWRVGVRGGGNDATSRSYNLSARLCNPTCGSWFEVDEDPNTSGIVYSPDDVLTHNSATTNQLSLSDKTFLAGVFLEQPGGTPAVAIGSTRQIEWEFSLKISESSTVVDPGDSMELRIQHDDGTALSAYTLPSITVGAASSGITGNFTGRIQ